jgi:hypothetical protein
MSHLLLALLVAGAEPEAANPLYRSLLEPGLAVGGDVRVKLPAPTLPDGLDAAKQKAVLEKVIGTDYAYDDFTRNSVVAPYKMVIRDEKSADEKTPVRAVDVWFVAHGDFAALDDEKFLDRLLNSGRGTGGKTAEVPAEELAKRKIAVPPELAKREHFGRVEFDFLDKVRLGVTGHTLWSKSADSLVAAVEVDPRFENVWQPIAKAGAGVKPGDPVPYTGVGLYVKLTKLAEPAGAVFVEQHVVFAEPAGWFDGANLLRSKLPPAMTKTVRSMRAEWAKGK